MSSEIGVKYGPNENGKHYLSYNKHRTGAGAGSNTSSIWNREFTRDKEYELFCTSDGMHWCCNKGDYWGIDSKGDTVLGTRDERLCKFEPPSNHTDPWHGYPVTFRSNINDFRPPNTPVPNDLVDKWLDEKVISRPFLLRIKRRQI